jgi:hypothetical protein
MGEWEYSTTIPDLGKVIGQIHGPASLTPGKETAVPIGHEAEWAPEPNRPPYKKKNLPSHYLGHNGLLHIQRALTFKTPPFCPQIALVGFV